MTGNFIFIFRHVVCLWWLHSWWPGQSAGWWLCIHCPECLKLAQSWILTRGQLISDRLNVACTFAWLCLPWFSVNVECPEFAQLRTAAALDDWQHSTGKSSKWKQCPLDFLDVSTSWFTIVQSHWQVSYYSIPLTFHMKV